MSGKDSKPEKDLIEKISADAEKKLEAKDKGKEIMFGLGAFGIVGWSIAVPVILGVALGSYLDRRFNPGFSWVLTCIFAGGIIGSINAWHWIKQKSKED